MHLTPAALLRLGSLSACERQLLAAIRERPEAIGENALLMRVLMMDGFGGRWRSTLQVGICLHSLRTKLRGSGVALHKGSKGWLLVPEILVSAAPASVFEDPEPTLPPGRDWRNG